MSQSQIQQIPLELIKFLEEELAIPTNSIELVRRHKEQDLWQFPMILWQYGLITLHQLDRIFDWMYEPSSTPRIR